MHIDIEKVITNLTFSASGKQGIVGTFWTDLSLGKERIEQLLDLLEKGELNIWDASDEIYELENKLRAEILRLLNERGIPIEYVTISSDCHEQYVNEYPTFFEWQVVDHLETPVLRTCYTEEDIAWMRKLLNTPFDAPAEERVKLYCEWQAYWERRDFEEEAKNSSFSK